METRSKESKERVRTYDDSISDDFPGDASVEWCFRWLRGTQSSYCYSLTSNIWRRNIAIRCDGCGMRTLSAGSGSRTEIREFFNTSAGEQDANPRIL